MYDLATVSFSVETFDDNKTVSHAVIPNIDDKPVTELITVFEARQHFKPSGGYGALIPEYFKYGPLDRYFLGDFEPNSYWASKGCIYLLGCDCGEVGCWPLECRIRLDGDRLIWEEFKQPHRPERDYTGFGPFAFDTQRYRLAVTELQRRISK
jgi:hypothetical protein